MKEYNYYRVIVKPEKKDWMQLSGMLTKKEARRVALEWKNGPFQVGLVAYQRVVEVRDRPIIV